MEKLRGPSGGKSVCGGDKYREIGGGMDVKAVGELIGLLK